MKEMGLTGLQWNHLGTILRDRFGLAALRDFQQPVIAHLIHDQSVLAVVSTGSGKSLCYQLPSVYWDAPVLVISPLVALMHHQTERMQSLGIAAEALTGQLTSERQREILARWENRDLRLLYVAPERLSHDRLLAALRVVRPRLLVVDEAHCISEWGYDFRPEYRRIRGFREEIGNPLLLALTATATERVKADIRFYLTAGDEMLHMVEGTVDRPNLYLNVEMVSSPKEQRLRVAELVQSVPGGAIIYCSTRMKTERWARELRQALGISVVAYHAGLAPHIRRQVEQDFIGGAVRVVAATTAFGMGIDRADIRQVIHVDVPDSLDSYYQEIGRAGRDGAQASAQMIIQPMDLYRRERWIKDERPSVEWIDHIVARLQVLPVGRAVLFEFEVDDSRTPVLLSVLEDMGVLTLKSGGSAARVIRLHDVTSFREALVYRLDQFWQRRFGLFQHMAQYVEATTCRRAHLVHYYGQSPATVDYCCDQCSSGNQTTVTRRADAQLVDALRTWRLDEARAIGSEPYIVMSDRDLMGIATKRPQSLEDLARCHGIGPKRRQRYGEALLRIVQEHASGTPMEAPLDQTVPRERAIWLFNSGVPFNDVVKEVGRASSTVRGYFVDWIADAPEAEWRHYLPYWFSAEDYATMAQLLDVLSADRLRPLYDALEGRFGFDQWDVARAVYRRTRTAHLAGKAGTPRDGVRTYDIDRVP